MARIANARAWCYVFLLGEKLCWGGREVNFAIWKQSAGLRRKAGICDPAFLGHSSCTCKFFCVCSHSKSSTCVTALEWVWMSVVDGICSSYRARDVLPLTCIVWISVQAVPARGTLWCKQAVREPCCRSCSVLLLILSRGKLMLRRAFSALIHQRLKLMFSSNSSSAYCRISRELKTWNWNGSSALLGVLLLAFTTSSKHIFLFEILTSLCSVLLM